MHRPVIIIEGLEIEPHPGLLGDEPVRPRADRLLHESVRTDLLVIIGRHYPAGATHVAGAQKDRKVEERLDKVKTDSAVVNNLDVLSSFVQYVGPGAAVTFVAPFDVGRCDRGAIVKLDAWAQMKSRAFGILGEFIA